MQDESESSVGAHREFAAEDHEADGPAVARDHDARLMLQRVAAKLLGEPQESVHIGRFEILDLLGEGGMGVVYAADDATLARKVAIKAIRGERLRMHPGERDRLLREARALAKLSHPNVVTVYEVHEDGPDVYIVMELIEGTTLAGWLATPRTLPEILGLFIQAGHGLHAAHIAGIVHRDFKPSNVLVAHDARVRIVDFGLARGDPTPADTTSPKLARAVDNTELTLATAAHAGTPAYMSPEQLRGLPCDARSDQFSFCVALYEAVYGKRPFAPGELAARIESGDMSTLPLGRPAPRWLRKALARGLSLRPEARYPSMAALLTVLEETPKQRRRIAWVALTGLTLVGAVVSGTQLRDPAATALCDNAGASLDAVWSDHQRVAIRRAFTETGLSYATSAATRTLAALDRYRDELRDARQEACKATHVRGERSEASLDTRGQCLDRATRSLINLCDVLVVAGPAVVGEAEALVVALPAPAACIDEAREPAPAPAPPRTDVALERLLDQGRILETTHQGAQAVAVLERLIADSRARGNPSFEAEALLLLGRTQIALLRAPKPAHETLHRAYDAASTAGRDDLLWAIWGALSQVAGYELDDLVGARVHLEHARSTLARTRDPEAELRLLEFEGLLASSEGHHTEAIALRRDILERVRSRPDAPAVAVIRARIALAMALALSGDLEASKQMHQDIWDDARERFGADHPWTARAEVGLGRDLFELGEHHAASLRLTHARAALAAAYGPRSPVVASVDLHLAQLAGESGHYEQAISLARAVLAVFDEYFPPSHGDRAATLSTLSGLYVATGDTAHQLEVSLALLDYFDAVGTDDRQSVPDVLTNVSESLCELGRCAEALPYVTRLMTLYTETPPEELGMSGFAAFGFGRVYTALGQLDLALPFLESAYMTFQTYPIDRDGARANIAAAARSLADALAGLHLNAPRVHMLRKRAAKIDTELAEDSLAGEPAE